MSSHSADDLVDSEGDPAEGLLVVGAGVVLPSPPVGQVDSGAVPAPVLPRVARGPVGPPRQGVLVLGVEGGDGWMREGREGVKEGVEEGVREEVKAGVEGGDGWMREGREGVKEGVEEGGERRSEGRGGGRRRVDEGGERRSERRCGGGG